MKIMRRGSLLDSALVSGSSGPGSFPGLCSVLGQDTLLSQCLYPPTCINEYRRTLCWEEPYSGLASHPGEVDKLRRPDGPLGSMQTLP